MTQLTNDQKVLLAAERKVLRERVLGLVAQIGELQVRAQAITEQLGDSGTDAVIVVGGRAVYQAGPGLAIAEERVAEHNRRHTSLSP